jgi:hypothetical protein
MDWTVENDGLFRMFEPQLVHRADAVARTEDDIDEMIILRGFA